jgi:hypothetical protein
MNPTQQVASVKNYATNLVPYQQAATTPRLRPSTRLSSNCWVCVPTTGHVCHVNRRYLPSCSSNTNVGPLDTVALVASRLPGFQIYPKLAHDDLNAMRFTGLRCASGPRMVWSSSNAILAKTSRQATPASSDLLSLACWPAAGLARLLHASSLRTRQLPMEIPRLMRTLPQMYLKMVCPPWSSSYPHPSTQPSLWA